MGVPAGSNEVGRLEWPGPEKSLFRTTDRRSDIARGSPVEFAAGGQGEQGTPTGRPPFRLLVDAGKEVVGQRNHHFRHTRNIAIGISLVSRRSMCSHGAGR